MMMQFRCSSTADVVVAAWAVALLVALLSGNGGGMNFANAQAPLIRVAQGVVSGLDAYTPCTLIDGGSRLACATGSSNGASKVITFYKNLYAALPALDKAIDYGVSAWNSKGPIYVAGNSEQFLLVSTDDAVYLGAVQVESKSPIRPIRRLGVQTAVQPFFALFFSDSLVIATEHRYVPGMYLRAATINLPVTGDYFVAAVLSSDDNVLLLTTKSMSVKRLEIAVNGLGRITTTSVMSDFLFQAQVPWRDVVDDTFYFIRERGPNYGAGGFREVFLSSNYLGQRCDVNLCTTCSCPDAVSKWYVLTQSYPTPYCPGVRLNTYDATLGNSLCAIFSPDLFNFAVTQCDFRTGYMYEDKNPTKFTPNCSAPRNRGAPYLNTSFVTSSSLFALPSGSASVTDVVADTYGPAFSVPTFMAPQSLYSDATMIIINGVVVITAFLQGSDCSTGLSTNTYVAGAAICIPNTRGTRFTVVIPLLGDPSITGSPRRVKQYLGYQVSAYSSSYTASGADRALPQIVYQALNGSAVVSSVGFAAAPLIPPLSSPTVSRLVTSQQLANMTFSQSYYALAAYNGFNIDDVLDNNDILYVSQGQSSGTRAALFKRPTQQIQTSSFYFTTMAENQWFNESVLYATCATQFTVRVMIVNTAVQDGVITSGLYQVVDPPLYAPSTMVLDSAVTFAGSTGVSMALFSAPCTVTTVVTITLRLSSNPSLSFKVNLTLLPGGQMPPTVGPTPIPTPAPPPPPTKTKPRETITQTCSEFLSSASPSETETNEQTLTGTLLESQSHFPTQSQETHSVTDTHDADVSGTLLHVTPEPTISSKLAAFPPLPENATNWTDVIAPQLPFPQGPVLLIQQLSSSAPPPSTFAVRVALPFSGVGQLFTRIAPSPASGSILTTRIDGVELLLRTTNATEALLFINASVAAVLNPEVDERNLTSRIPVNVTVWGEQILSTAAAANNNEVRVAGWDSWWYPLSNSIAINRGPKISPLINCSRSVMRGGRFDLSLGSVLTHPLHMPLSMSVVGSGQQITIPASIRVDCNITGSCGIRGVATDDTPIQYRIGGSDGYYSVFASCTLTPFYVSLRASSDLQQQPLVLNVKAAASFVLTIPLDLFISSLPITMIAVTLDDGYPLPASINFAQPNTLRGTIATVQVLFVRVKAVDLYSEAYVTLALNSSDNAPTVVAPWEPIRVLAGVPFSALRYHAGILSDPDPSDLITCSAELSTLSQIPWVSVATISPATLQISGSPPSGQAVAIDVGGGNESTSSSLFPHDKNVSIRLLCSDGVLSVNASLQLNMQEAVTPLQTAWLPNITAPADEVMQTTVDVSLFFRDPAGGTVILGAVAPGANGLAVWLQLQRVSDTVLQLSGVPPVDQAGGTTSGTTTPLMIRVRNVFGNETQSLMFITVTATTWQLVQEYSALIYSILGLLLTALSFWFYWVPIVNTVMLPWRRTQCPLMLLSGCSAQDEEGTRTPKDKDNHDNQLTEDDDGLVSFAVYKTCHDLVGYVKLPNKVAGRLRRCFGCVGALASYWDLQISYDCKLPKWLYLRGDGRVVFCADDGDDGIEDIVVVHEVNVYGVVLREYSCEYRKIVECLAEYGGGGGEGILSHSKSKQQQRSATRGNNALPLLLHERVDDEEENLDVDDLSLLVEDVDQASASHVGYHHQPRDATTTMPGGDPVSLKDLRRQQVKLDAMKRQLTQQLHASAQGIHSHLEERLALGVGEVNSKLDALSALIVAQLSSRNGSLGNGGGGSVLPTTSRSPNIENINEIFLRENAARYNNNTATDDLLQTSLRYFGDDDPNRIRDPLAELNRALKGSDQKGRRDAVAFL